MRSAEADKKIYSIESLRTERARLRKAGKTVVQCHGCFDIVHPGHIRYLRMARSLGDVLVVTVSADDVVMKGYERPYIPEDLRLDNLAELGCVDYVALSEDEWAGPVLEAIQPDIYVKGREYESKVDPRFAKEKKIVESYGGRVVLGSGDVIFSSTEIGRRKRNTLDMEQQKIQRFCQVNEINPARLKNAISAFSDLKVLVLGDAILDQYTHCEGARVASESPIVSVKPVSEEWFIGGAGLIARQAAVLGAKVTFVTCCEEDESFERIRSGLERFGVEVHNLPAPGRRAYTKTRFLVGGKKVFKVDRGNPAPIPIETSDELITMLREQLEAHDGLIVTDFGYGLFGPTLANAIPKIAAKCGKPYFADVSTNGQANILKFREPQLATPTEDELRFALGDAESGLSNLASRYYTASDARGLIVTMGRRGSLCFRPPQGEGARLRTDYLPALEINEVDAVGAGDVFLTG
ncbi:MAG: adenylyltransferase/cytidyltransferase family protein, partial [Deltaproteobacteria bacterium]|nr:adenylyltransferase/cytidyltransferase family protein [Deltaproteobacteria bacterium]